MLLEVESLVSGYGGSQVVLGVDFAVDAGQILTVLGPNGAGKTTLLRSIAGAISPTSGRVVFNGQDVTKRGCTKLSREGLVLVPEGRHLFGSLSVLDNLKVAARQRRGEVRLSIDDAFGVFPALHNLRGRKASALSGGQQQMVAIARGLVMSPRVLLIDELTLGLAPVVIEQLITSLRDLVRNYEMALVVSDQSLSLVGRIGDDVVLMTGGRSRSMNSGEDLARLQQRYFGDEAEGSS
jgi:ABC-type branched-subunit amino acid transport system ATPase component